MLLHSFQTFSISMLTSYIDVLTLQRLQTAISLFGKRKIGKALGAFMWEYGPKRY